jgi:putative ABC transport system permease protein
LARHFWGEASPLGQRLRNVGEAVRSWREIVGVVDDVRDVSLKRPPGPQLYFPQRQLGELRLYMTRTTSLMVRTTLEPEVLIGPVREVLWELDPEVALGDARAVAGHVSDSISTERFAAALLGGLAVVAWVLAVLGISGVLSYTTALRVPEIGVRIALGASPGSAAALVIREAIAVTLVGLVVGTVAVHGLSRWMESLLYEVEPLDPVILLTTFVVLLAAAVAAAAVPARRASRVDPAVSLRCD